MASVVVRGQGGLKQVIEIRDKKLVADEPAEHGGSDEGPSPYELLLAALGACTAMTITLYARGKGWDLQEITVELEHDRIHAEDCRDCETDEGFLDRITKRITIDGPLHEEQRAKLEEIARRCPVQRTLNSEVKIEDELLLAAYR